MEDKKLDLLEEVVVAAEEEVDGEPGEGEVGPVHFVVTGTPDSTGPCRYKITIAATAQEDGVSNVSFHGQIKTNLFTLLGIVPPPPTNPTIGTATTNNAQGTVDWTLGNLIKGKTETLDILIDYKAGGAALDNACPFEDFPTTFYSFHDALKTEHKGKIKECKVDFAACQTNCCDCLCVETKNVPFAKCEDQKTETVDVKVTPEGKLLFVNLRFPSACPNKDIAVLVVVTEVEGQNEVPIAHRIIKKPKSSERTDCETLPECQKILFAIPPKECTSTACSATDPVCDCACGEARTFKVRTTAHYLDRTPIDICKCCERDTVTE